MEPGLEAVPVGHVRHSDPSENVPAGQDSQALWSALGAEPGAQVKQEVDPEPETVPGAQGRQLLPLKKVPAGQL